MNNFELWSAVADGGIYYPYAPHPDAVNIERIAAALAKINRFNGHTVLPYSVASHSILVQSILKGLNSTPVVVGGLLHDAHEAYIGDMIMPLKRGVLGPEMNRLSDSWDRAIAAKLGVGQEWFTLPAVKEADVVALWMEAEELIGGPRLKDWNISEGVKAAADAARGRGVMVPLAPSWRHAEQDFLERYYAWRARL